MRSRSVSVGPSRATIFLIVLLSLPTLASCATAARGGASGKSVDDYIRHEMFERHIVGMGVAVIQRGKVTKVGAYGQASIEHGLPVRASTPFSVASVTKSFTSVAVMMLVETGNLRLEDPIRSHLSGLPAKWRDVTVRQLLNHTSGLPDVSIDDFTSATIAETPAEALRLLADRPMSFPPGSNYQYNQTNYVLLGMLIEHLSGKPYEEFCAERLFAPLKLQSPVFGDARTIVRQRATTYTLFRYGGPRPIPLNHAEVLNAEMPAMTYPGGGAEHFDRGFCAVTRRTAERKADQRSQSEGFLGSRNSKRWLDLSATIVTVPLAAIWSWLGLGTGRSTSVRRRYRRHTSRVFCLPEGCSRSHCSDQHTKLATRVARAMDCGEVLRQL